MEPTGLLCQFPKRDVFVLKRTFYVLYVYSDQSMFAIAPTSPWEKKSAKKIAIESAFALIPSDL